MPGRLLTATGQAPARRKPDRRSIYAEATRARVLQQHESSALKFLRDTERYVQHAPRCFPQRTKRSSPSVRCFQQPWQRLIRCCGSAPGSDAHAAIGPIASWRSEKHPVGLVPLDRKHEKIALPLRLTDACRATTSIPVSEAPTGAHRITSERGADPASPFSMTTARPTLTYR